MGARTPHDALFKQIFSDPVEAAAELRHALPADVADDIAWDTLRLESGELTSLPDDLRADLVFSATWRARTVLLHVLLEHKSYADDWVALQLLGYTVRLWEAWKKQHRSRRRPPAVFSVVVYHGRRPWTGPRSMTELIDLDAAGRERARDHLPELRFALDDLSADPEIEKRAMSPGARLALFCLQRARQAADLLSELDGWSECLREVRTPEHLVWLEWYIMTVCGEPRERVDRFFADKVAPDMTKKLEPIRELIGEEYRERGRVEVLLRLLEQRFGTLPPEIVARMHSAPATEVDGWITRVLTATSLEDLLSD